MRILIAPDKFKGALDARSVAEALALGVQDALPDARIELCPLADGGEGSGALLAAALGAEQRAVEALDPLGRRRTASWWFAAAAGVAIVEMAEASGLHLLDTAERDALRATTYGTGQLLRAALDASARRVLLAVGGSATVDGGAGCLQALGHALLDETGRVICAPAGGGALSRVVDIRPPVEAAQLELTILADVDNPLVGPDGAAAVYGPQKGASAQQVQQLEENLRHWADVLRDSLGEHRRQLWSGAAPEPDPLRHGGAAGGLPYGLEYAFRVECMSGIEGVSREVDLGRRLRSCDLCLTGEGRIDGQTARGKVVGGVARIARQYGRPVIAFTGVVKPAPGQSDDELAAALGLERIVVITPPGTDHDEALARTAKNLRQAAGTALREWN